MCDGWEAAHYAGFDKTCLDPSFELWRSSVVPGRGPAPCQASYAAVRHTYPTLSSHFPSMSLGYPGYSHNITVLVDYRLKPRVCSVFDLGRLIWKLGIPTRVMAQPHREQRDICGDAGSNHSAVNTRAGWVLASTGLLARLLVYKKSASSALPSTTLSSIHTSKAPFAYLQLGPLFCLPWIS